MAKKVPAEVQEALEEFYADIFLNVMIAMTKAESVEAGYAKFQEVAKQSTKEQLQRIARLAGQYYAQHANPAPPRERVAVLKVQAIEFALRQWDNEKAK